MKIGDHLSKEQKQQLNHMTKRTPNKKRSKPKKKKRKAEKVNWVEIMGMNRDRYGRGPGGALRRK